MRSPFIRPNVASMVGYVPGEQPQDQRYIKLNTNENPYPPSPRVIEAVRAVTTADLRLYPDPLANTLRDRAATVYGLQRDNILVGNGSDELLGLIVRACVGTGDRVVFPYPTYSLYDTLVTMQEGEIVHVPYPADFSLPEGLGTARGRLTFVCHPNSPSGTAGADCGPARVGAAGGGCAGGGRSVRRLRRAQRPASAARVSEHHRLAYVLQVVLAGRDAYRAGVRRAGDHRGATEAERFIQREPAEYRGGHRSTR